MTYVGIIVYADDILLLSASVNDLQSMINVCSKVGGQLDISFNATKSQLLAVGKDYKKHRGKVMLG